MLVILFDHWRQRTRGCPWIKVDPSEVDETRDHHMFARLGCEPQYQVPTPIEKIIPVHAFIMALISEGCLDVLVPPNKKPYTGNIHRD